MDLNINSSSEFYKNNNILINIKYGLFIKYKNIDLLKMRK